MERVKVKYTEKSRSPGFEAVYLKTVAEVLEKRGEVEILGSAADLPKPEKKGKKVDRGALIKEAIALNLGSKEDFVGMSDSELVELVDEGK